MLNLRPFDLSTSHWQCQRQLIFETLIGNISNYPKLNDSSFFQQIVGYPSTKVLTSEEKDLVWQFQFYLTNQKKVTYGY